MWSKTMASDALECARDELGAVFVHYDDKAVGRELSQAKVHIDRARAIIKGIKPDRLIHVTMD